MDYDALFHRLHPALYRYLYRLTGDADTADDIAQETFVRLLRQSMPESEVRPWLFTVATNLVRDGVRKAGRRQRLLAAERFMPASVPRPDEMADRAEQVELVRRALAQIPLRDRQLLLMREEGFTYEEMARAAGVAPGSVGTLLGRALRRFAQVYRAQDGRAHEETDGTRG
ncbi:MAG TPA: sigma-70 family RNA polymerase sigma factor [Longimicrobiales bacterium]